MTDHYNSRDLTDEQQDELKTWVCTLGLDPNEVSIHFAVEGDEVHLNVFLRDDKGWRYADPTTGKVGQRTVTAPLTDAPTWLQAQHTMAG